MVLAREARIAGVNYLVAAAFEKETDPHLESLVDEMEWLRVGQLSKLIKFFKKIYKRVTKHTHTMKVVMSPLS